ncbi:MAG: 50S ribosomal protein L11 methyltransferase [Xanthomonadaceae bacterium]|nr:50S ribosomal protein L11 methyltransferase [Xanthomonadaceae bacterium]
MRLRLIANHRFAPTSGIANHRFAPTGGCDFLVANILAGPLVALAPHFGALTAPGARIAVSGLIERQIDEVRAAYADWCPLDEVVMKDGWVRLSGSRR